MTALILKLTLAPALVFVATVVARRAGSQTGGLISGLPVVAGPIVVIYAVEQGEAFARESAGAAVLGVLSLVAFCVLYAALAGRAGAGAIAALAGATLAFAAGTALLAGVELPIAAGATLSLAAIAAGAAATRRLTVHAPRRPPVSDLLPLRLVITAALVLALTGAAHGLPAHLAGLLVPLPVVTAVLAVFSHLRAGPAAAVELLAGIVLALPSFLAFFVVLAEALALTGPPAAFALAAATSVATWLLVARYARSLPRSGRPAGPAAA